MNPRDLPIYAIARELVAAAAGGGRRIVLQAPTGSGKSTQVPQILLEAGLVPAGQQTIVLQPRRLAARLLAARVAVERDAPLGGEIGYQVRFEDRTSAATRVTFVTEGILLRRLIGAPTLPEAAVLIFDEFHERHLFGDVTLARALVLQRTLRPDLTLIVMSATLDRTAVATYLEPCTVLRAEGRVFPVRTEYLPKPVDAARHPVWEQAAAETVRLLAAEPAGDALVFMPGVYEINRTLQALAAQPAVRGCDLLPLHGELPPREQDAAVAAGGRRKIVVATNVAETSLTIPGVRIVVDSGLARVARFDPYRGIDTLLVERISRAAADQRAGRAGRTAPGVCSRLWTEREQQDRPAYEVPEIRRVDLAETVLMLKAGGFADVRTFPWFEAPEARTLERAERLLTDLGAIAEDGAITGLGRRLLAFPLHPRYARMLIAAEALGCVRAVALMAALTQERSLLLRRPGEAAVEQRDRQLGEEERSDFFVLMRAWQAAAARDYDLAFCQGLGVHAGAARQVGRLAALFERLARGQGLPLEAEIVADERLQRCLLAGFADQVARRLDGGTLRCELVHGRRGTLARDSVCRDSALIVAADVREIEGKSLDVVLGLATAIDAEWLHTLFPEAIRTTRRVRLDPDTRRVVAERLTAYHDLALEVRRGETPGEDEAARVLADEVLAGRTTLARWDHEVDQWLHRVNGLRQWCPELGLPGITEADRRDVVEHVCRGAYGLKDIKDRPVLPVVKAWLSGAQQALVEQYAPERLALPGGRRVRVTYAASGPPTVAARIQDLYGVKGGLTVARGRQPVTIQVLAPNNRPVQITSDLGTFWKDGYPRVKQELQRKYPRHEWR